MINLLICNKNDSCHKKFIIIRIETLKKRKITKDDNQKITYASSGVNIEKANDLIEEIKPIIKNTQRLGADGTIGGFGGILI